MDYLGDISVSSAHETKRKHIEKENEGEEESDTSLTDFDEETVKVTFLSVHIGSTTVVETEGQYAITGGEDGRVCAWDISDGRCLYETVAHTEPVTGLAFLASEGIHMAEVVKGRIVVTGSKDGAISQWPFEHPMKMMSLHTDDAITCLTSLADDFIIIGTELGKLVCRRIDDLKKIDTVEIYPSSSVLCLSVQRSTSSIACLDDVSTSICVWSFVHGQFKKLYTFAIHSINIDAPTVKLNCLCMRNEKLYAGDDTGSLHIFDWKTGSKTVLSNTLVDNHGIAAILATDEFLVTCSCSTIAEPPSKSHLNIRELVSCKLTKQMKFDVGHVVALAYANSQDKAKFIVAGTKLAIIEACKSTEICDDANQTCSNDIAEQKVETGSCSENISAGDCDRKARRKRVECVLS